jgi:hypothetical protein
MHAMNNLKQGLGKKGTRMGAGFLFLIQQISFNYSIRVYQLTQRLEKPNISVRF